jgi:hypothetical protein
MEPFKNFVSGGVYKKQDLSMSQKSLRNLLNNLNTGLIHLDQQAKAISSREESDIEAAYKPDVNSDVAKVNEAQKFFEALSNLRLNCLLVGEPQN